MSDNDSMDKDAIIEKLRQYIKLLEEKIQRLEEKIAQLEKNSSNSSKPPSSDIVKPLKILRRFGRKRKCGGQHGHRRFLRQPFEPQQVDEVIEYELKGKDAVGLICADYWGAYRKLRRLIIVENINRDFFGFFGVLREIFLLVFWGKVGLWG